VTRRTVTLFLCGDVMTGRGVDQILRHPGAPDLREPFISDARDYVGLAELVNGPIPRPVDAAYIWGDALAELDRVAPDARIINLETTITSSDAYWPRKPIHYRMHPANIACLTAARIDVCALANNHALDYGYAGLADTLHTLQAAGIRTTGAGQDRSDAQRPATVELAADRRAVVFSLASEDGGIPSAWSATPERAGVDLLDNLSDATADRVLERVAQVARRGDVVIASIHWGSNWGYGVPPTQVRFAHRLLDGDVALIHGHSSHHPRPIEVYKDKLVLYGCGDFLTDYEGISGHEEYRADLALMYFPTLDPVTGTLVALRMTPIKIRRMRATRPSWRDGEWLCATLARASEELASASRSPTPPRATLRS
jgi:poly-gamma-glutamate capsule biosynthesis protein CapA/YwtB (metallophosphatase superfamily)